MDALANLATGFGVALTWQNVGYCFIGVFLGTVVGVLPGIGPVTTVAMLLPISFTLHPVSAMIMLAGIYYGAQYGGSTTAILVNIPGEASSVVTTIDGHKMAQQGRAGPALGIAAIGSFFAGCAATLLICLAAPPLAAIALQFGPAEKVREETRKLIEIAGKGGGFIMSSRGVLDEADPKMVKVWAEATREFGVYP